MSDEDDLLHTTIPAALEALEQSDSFEAVAQLLAAGEPQRIIQSFHLMVRELFSRRKLPQMVSIGRSGVEYALRESLSADDPDLREHLQSSARKLAYNVSANLWPGWADEAVQPTSSDLESALDLAKLHYRLVLTEGLDSGSIGNARWLVGAQKLAIGKEQAAHFDFETAKAAYKQAGQSASEWMAEGFQSLALQLMGTMGTEGLHRFEAAIEELKKLGDEGEFFADQLQAAKRVFLAK